jgi:4-hydroxybenzoate polyprenyltransferase
MQRQPLIAVCAAKLRLYALLLRLHKPAGIGLLLWPCLWGLALGSLPEATSWRLIALFALGALTMRSAGCILNDMADRRIDAQVVRTQNRPLASGAVSMSEAFALLGLLLAIALWVVLQLPPLLLGLAAGALVMVAAYPFMKRITYWPQAFLGLTFNLGALFGWVAASGGEIGLAAWLLYAAGICWTIGYDSIYAHQDIEDDLRIGVKSTAIRFGENSRAWIAAFYAASALCFALALWLAGSGIVGWGALTVMLLHLGWQCWRFQVGNPALAWRLFASNASLGAGISALLLLSGLLG